MYLFHFDVDRLIFIELCNPKDEIDEITFCKKISLSRAFPRSFVYSLFCS